MFYMYKYQVTEEQDRIAEAKGLELFLAKEGGVNGATSAIGAAAAKNQNNPLSVRRQNIRGYKCQWLFRFFGISRGMYWDTDTEPWKQGFYLPDMKGAGLVDLHLKTHCDPCKPTSWLVDAANNVFFRKSSTCVGLDYDEETRILTVHWIVSGDICLRASDLPIAHPLKDIRRGVYFDYCEHPEFPGHRHGFVPLKHFIDKFIPLEKLRLTEKA